MVFNFSWDDCNTEEKLGKMAMQSFEGNKGAGTMVLM